MPTPTPNADRHVAAGRFVSTRPPDLIVAAIVLTAIVAMWLLAPLAPQPDTVSQFRWAAYLTTGIFSLLLGALAFTLAPRLLDLGGRRLAVIALCALVAVVVLNVLEIPVASDLAKVVLALSAAPVLLLPIDRPWWLLPLAILLPAADVWSVYSSRGVTHAIVSRAAHDKSYIDWPTIATPIAGFDYPDFGRSGIVDVLFLTLFICAAVRWKLGARRLVFVLPLSVVATMVLAYETSLRAVPLLPMLCLGFLICTLPALWRDFRAELSSRER